MADKPLIDLRIYTIRPRGMPQYLKLFEELALPSRSSISASHSVITSPKSGH